MENLSFVDMLDLYCKTHPGVDRDEVARQIMLVILGKTGVETKDNGDGTFTHTYTLTDPRAAHASDDWESKPL